VAETHVASASLRRFCYDRIMPLFTTLLSAAVVVLVLALAVGKDAVAAGAKVVASACFLGLALAVGAHTYALGRVFLAALVLSFAGDVLLIGKSPRWLSAGIFAFLGAHVMFVVAFFVRGLDGQRAAIGLACVLVPSIALARWILRHASDDMRPKVLAYVVVISAMVAAAAGTIPWLSLAATLFYLSDICVARHRFVKAEIVNRAIGLPLYYAAQWMFAMASAAV
jgi:uncharacterized membrane protein YhhN